MKKDAPDEIESESGVSETLASTGSLASVVIFNCTVLSITALNANGANVVPIQGIAGISAIGSPPSGLAVPRSSFGSSASIAATFEGYTRPSWTSGISIQQLPTINMYLWCYLNGFMLVDQNGIVNYMFGQSSMNLMAMGDSDEWPKQGRIISMAL